MDKETLSNYGWIVICVMVLAVMIALATPFGGFIRDAVWSTTNGLFDVQNEALNAAGIVTGGSQPGTEESQPSTVSGSYISVNDVVSTTQNLTVNLSSGTINDFSAVKVTKLGKNLFDMNAFVESGHVTVTGDEMLWYNTSNMLAYKPDGMFDGQYTLQFNVKTPLGHNAQASFFYTDGTVESVGSVSNNEDWQFITFTSKEGKIIDYIKFGGSGGMAVGTIFKNVQFERGSVATTYESYSRTEHTASANGMVNGIQNSSSTFMLITNADDVEITCEYQKKN